MEKFHDSYALCPLILYSARASFVCTFIFHIKSVPSLAFHLLKAIISYSKSSKLHTWAPDYILVSNRCT